MSIENVARQAGVSVATVSRVFNSPEVVREVTRERVERVAKRLGYQANASARTLRTQRSKVLGVALPTLLNPVFAECLEGIAEAATARGYSIIPVTTNYRVDDESAAVQRLASRTVDGLILVVADPASSPALQLLRRMKLPYVLAYNRHPGHPCVSVDNEGAVAAAVHRLHALGHRRIAMVSGQLTASDRATQRYEGYRRGLRECRLGRGRLLELPFMDHAVQQLTDLLRLPQRPTALVCSNDLLAIRSLRAAALAGLHVPRDLSIVGFDGIELGCDLTPSLGTIVQPNRAIGIDCVRLLSAALAGHQPLRATASVTLPYLVRDGESIAAPAA